MSGSDTYLISKVLILKEVVVNPACKQASLRKGHDFIPLVFPNHNQFLEKVAQLYKACNSLSDIVKIVGLSKSKTRHLVSRAGIPLRTLRDEKRHIVVGSRGKRRSKPPYGYWYINGEIQKHPKEYPIVLEIIAIWKSGRPKNSIASLLNRRGIKSPKNKKWLWNSINNIVLRLKSDD